jgi:hypothetical protein
MRPEFEILTKELEAKYLELLAMPAIRAEAIPSDTPIGGIYQFSENGVPMYTGRTKRKISVRVRNHFSAAPDCPFAWLLAREVTGYKRTYKKEGSRRDSLLRDDFQNAYLEAKMRIRKMDVRFVEEADPLRQTLLEIYIAVSANSRYNDFDTH